MRNNCSNYCRNYPNYMIIVCFHRRTPEKYNFPDLAYVDIELIRIPPIRHCRNVTKSLRGSHEGHNTTPISILSIIFPFFLRFYNTFICRIKYIQKWAWHVRWGKMWDSFFSRMLSYSPEIFCFSSSRLNTCPPLNSLV